MAEKPTKADTTDTAAPQSGETTVGMVKMIETVTLLVPFKSPVDQRDITVVTMRRPKVKDQLNHFGDGDPTARGIVGMIADLIDDFTPADMGEMDSADFNTLRDALFSFLGITPESEDESKSSG